MQVPQAAQVNDALDFLPGGGQAEIDGRLQIGCLELAGAQHQRMDEIIGRIHIGQGPVQRFRFQDIRFHPFGARPFFTVAAGIGPGDGPHPVAAVHQFRHQPPADISRRPGDQDDAPVFQGRSR